MSFDDIPLTLLEQEVFCECGAWKNFHDLEDNLSLDELIVLYEAACERQGRLSKIVAASMGADIQDDSEPYEYLYSDSETSKTRSEKRGVSPYAIDPKEGGEATPAYGKEEIEMLPINVGYSIIDKQD